MTFGDPMTRQNDIGDLARKRRGRAHRRLAGVRRRDPRHTGIDDRVGVDIHLAVGASIVSVIAPVQGPPRLRSRPHDQHADRHVLELARLPGGLRRPACAVVARPSLRAAGRGLLCSAGAGISLGEEVPLWTPSAIATRLRLESSYPDAAWIASPLLRRGAARVRADVDRRRVLGCWASAPALKSGHGRGDAPAGEGQFGPSNFMSAVTGRRLAGIYLAAAT